MLSSLIGALVGGGAALLGSFLAYRYQSRLERLRAGREKLAPVYEDLIRIVQDASSLAKPGTREYRDNVTKMRTFRRTLCIWGSTEIVKAYDTWGRMANSLNPAAPVDDPELMSKRVLAELLAIIRRDMGHTHDEAASEALVRLFVNEELDDTPGVV